MTTRTRKAIEDSFLRLAAKKPVDKITVKEIVEDCGINRNSFYYHFEDLPDLIEKTLQERMNTLIETEGTGSGPDLARAAIRSISEHQNIFRSIYFSKNRELLEKRLLHLSDQLIRRYLEDYFQFSKLPISAEDKETIINSYKWVIIGLIVDWVNNSNKMDAEAEFDRLYRLRSGALNTMLARAEASYKEEQMKKGSFASSRKRL